MCATQMANISKPPYINHHYLQSLFFAIHHIPLIHESHLFPPHPQMVSSASPSSTNGKSPPTIINQHPFVLYDMGEQSTKHAFNLYITQSILINA